MKIGKSIFVAAMIVCGCARGPHPGIELRVAADGVTLDGARVEEQSLRQVLQQDFAKFGPGLTIRIVVSPEIPIGTTIAEIAQTGFWNLTFSVEGETNAIAFIPRPADIFGPPVVEIASVVAPSGTFATTNSQSVPAESADHPWGNRVFFRATPETTGRMLYGQMREWQAKHADLYWDDNIRSNHASHRTIDPRRVNVR